MKHFQAIRQGDRWSCRNGSAEIPMFEQSEFWNFSEVSLRSSFNESSAGKVFTTDTGIEVLFPAKY